MSARTSGVLLEQLCAPTSTSLSLKVAFFSGLAIYYHLLGGKKIPSLKLTASSPLKIGRFPK